MNRNDDEERQDESVKGVGAVAGLGVAVDVAGDVSAEASTRDSNERTKNDSPGKRLLHNSKDPVPPPSIHAGHPGSA